MTVIFTGSVKKAGGFRVADVAVPVAPAFTIGQSLLFNEGDAPHMSRTPSSGDRDKWTFSVWLKLGDLNGRMIIQARPSLASSNDRYTDFTFLPPSTGGDGELEWAEVDTGGTYPGRLITTQVFRDPSAWMHLVFVYDSANSTASNRMKIYNNGVQITSFSTETYVDQNEDSGMNAAVLHDIGVRRNNGNTRTSYFDGYMSQTAFVDGTALDPTSFGEFDSNGDWQPIDVSGLTFGTNGFLLDYAIAPDGGGSASGTDVSGNGNNWTESASFVTSDQVSDSPSVGSSNYCTLNPLDQETGGFTTLSNGNLTVVASNDGGVGTTFGVESGKWYWEITVDSVTGGANTHWYGIILASLSQRNISNGLHNGSNEAYFYRNLGTKQDSGGTTSYGPAFVTNDIIGIALDIDNGAIWYSLNDSWIDGDGSDSSETVKAEIEAGTTTSAAFTGLSGKTWRPDIDLNGGGSTINFGQTLFTGSAPSGFLTLNSSNLPTPTIANPSDHFNTILYEGTGSAHTETGVGFKPDLVWTKTRSATGDGRHLLFDVLRGVGDRISIDRTQAEANDADTLTAFDSDGFTLGTDAGNNLGINLSGIDNVAWNWKANGSGVENTDGFITSTVSANTAAGFSIVKYVGDPDVGGRTVGHGLGAVPDFMMFKLLNAGGQWAAYHSSNTSLPAHEYLRPDGTQGTLNSAGLWADTLPDQDVFTVRTDAGVNGDGNDYIAYVWTGVEGYSKFGSYTGNASVDGPFVYCGFRPAWIMFKPAETVADWTVMDNTRGTYNLDISNKTLNSNLTSAEHDGSAQLDFLSNGFKIRNANTDTNAASNIVFAAFAESPFKTARAR